MRFDEETIDKIFDRCEEIEISLNEDPIQMGPKYLNNMVAITRNYMNEVQKYEREIIREKCSLERVLNKKQTEYDMRSNDLLSNNEEVRSQKSVKDRQAKIATILSDLKDEIKTLESQLTDLGHAESFVESKIRELRDVNRDIRLQKRLIEDEIEVGAHWGDDNTKDFSAKHHEAKEIDISDNSLFPEGQQPEEVSTEEYEEMFTSEEDEEDETDLNTALEGLAEVEDDDMDEDAALAQEEEDWSDLDAVFE